MKPKKETPGPGATGSGGHNVEVRKSKNTTTTCEAQEEQELYTALLAELRRDLVLSKMDTLKIERLGIALKHRLISVRQCLARQLADDPSPFAGVEGGP